MFEQGRNEEVIHEDLLKNVVTKKTRISLHQQKLT